jgi:anti-sigma factor RsiW
VNGRLNAAEAAPVRAHMESCAECAREYAQQRCVFEAMQADDSIAFASEAAFQKLAARLDAAPAPLAARRRPTLFWLVAASLVAALGLSAWGGWALQRASASTSARYLTLTAPQATGAQGAQLRVVFTPDLTLAELERLLHSIDAHISAGPTAAGVFTLTLPPGRDSSAEVAQRLAVLRANAKVRFAEPVMAAP